MILGKRDILRMTLDIWTAFQIDWKMYIVIECVIIFNCPNSYQHLTVYFFTKVVFLSCETSTHGSVHLELILAYLVYSFFSLLFFANFCVIFMRKNMKTWIHLIINIFSLKFEHLCLSRDTPPFFTPCVDNQVFWIWVP